MNNWRKCCKDEDQEHPLGWATWSPLETLTKAVKGRGEDESQIAVTSRANEKRGLGTVRIDSIFKKSYREEKQINGRIASADSLPPASSKLCS